MSHTPGPWLLGGALDSPGMIPVPIFDSAKSERCIAQVYPWLGADGNPDTQHNANARLIAAAPDLLELAEQYASECGECNGSGRDITLLDNGEYGPDIDCEACADIRAVIAQATQP